MPRRPRLACQELEARTTPAGLPAGFVGPPADPPGAEFIGPPALPPYLRAAVAGGADEVTAKFGDDLGQLVRTYLAAPGPVEAFRVAADQQNAGSLQVAGGRVAVEATAAVGGTAAALSADLTATGAEVVATYGRVVAAWVPVDRLGAAAGLPSLSFGYPTYKPQTAVGKVEDQGVPALRADVGGKRYGVTGSGGVVGVLSDSFGNLSGGYASDVASGDLPAGVNVVSDLSSGGTDEGRAMAQLVYDTAPGTGLAFHTAFVGGEAGFATGITKLATPVASGGAGANVVTDDVFYYHEPFFQDGLVAQAVDTIATTYGVPEFSSAGNQARSAYQSAFNSTAATVVGTSGTWHNFNPSGAADVYMPFSVGNGAQLLVDLQWDEPFASASTGAPGTAGAANSVALYFVNAAKTAVLASATASVVGGDPYRFLTYTNNTGGTATVYVAMRLTAGTAPGAVKFLYTGASPTLYATNTGASFGHNRATYGAGVAAAWATQTPAWGTSPALKESFSSAGGTAILFDKAGTRLTTPDLRSQPRFTSVDGTDTTFFGGNSNGTYLPAFFGTSAAAPHAAGVAALVRQAVPTLTPLQIYSVLSATALDMGTAGYDFDTGAGLIQADRALAAAANISAAGKVFRDFANDGTFNGADVGQAGVSVFLDSNANGVRDAGTSAALASADVPKAIPDGTGTGGNPSRVTSSLAVSGLTGRVTKATVKLSVTHTYDSDLLITLISPSGIRVPLLMGNGGSGVNFTNTVFDDAATLSLPTSSTGAPFTNSYKPRVALAALIGDDPNGTWLLEARDTYQTDTGTITAWSLTLGYADPAATTDAGGNYAFTGLPTTGYYGGTYNVREVVPAGFTQTSPATPPGLTLGVGQQAAGVSLGNYAPLTTIASVAYDGGTAQRSLVRKVTVTLNGTVTAGNIAAGAFTVTQTSGPTVAFTTSVDSVTAAGGQTVVVLKFSGAGLVAGSLADGRYSLVIDGSKIVDSLGTGADAGGTVAPGTTGTRTFLRLYGDINGDGFVDGTDETAFGSTFGLAAANPGFAAPLDWNGDGFVDGTDETAFGSRFGTGV